MKMNTAFDVLQKLSFDTRLIALLRSCGRRATVPIAVLAVFLAVGAGAPTAFAQETVSGQVTDAETNASLPGVNVLLQGTQTGATTDAQGRYELEVPNPEQDTLVFSFVGYQDREIPINGRSEVNVTMESQAVAQDEVVVVGYGEQQQQDLTGSVSSISTEEIEQVSPSSPESILQGRMAGVQVTQSSAEPGGGLSVRIRGTGSITSGSEPLYVIDGVPVQNDAGQLPGPTFGDRVSRPNPLASLNPQDIASINVLKDASATAIYGARGANGVVLITTKRGQEGDAQVNFSSYIGLQQIANTYDLLSASQFAQLANEALVNRGQEPAFENPQSLGEGTDWQDEVYNDSQPMQNYQLTASGGDEDTRFYVSGNYSDKDGIVRNTGFGRYAFRANYSQDISDRFRVGNSLTVSRALHDQNRTEGPFMDGPSSGALFYPSILPVRNEEAGRYSWTSQDLPYGASVYLVNPVGWVEEVSDKMTIDRVLGNVFAEYDLLENLQLKTDFGVDIENLTREYYESDRMILQFDQGGYARTHHFKKTSLLSETTLKYTGTLGERHDLDVTGGFTWQEEETETQNIQDSGFLTDERLYNNNLGSGAQEGGPNVDIGSTEWTLLSFLARTNYTFDNKYLLTFTARADGSSKFGENNRWGFFPSGALAWRISEEPFMQDQDLISNLKARVSYGLTGNQSIGTYEAISRLSPGQYVFGTSPVTSYAPDRLGNPDLQWETARQLDMGLDVGFWDQRLRFTADYFRKTTENLLLPVTLPFESGFTSSIQNAGSMRNTGFELFLGADPLVGTFSWSTSANFALTRNEVTDLGQTGRFFGPGFAGKGFGGPGGLVEEGRPIGVYYGFETAGIFADQEEIQAHGAQPGAQPGDIKFVDTDADGEITEADRTVIGNPHPDFTYGWSNDFSYGGFNLSLFVQGVYGSDIMHPELARLEGMTGFDLENNSTVRRFEGRWTPENRDAEYPRAGYNAGGIRDVNDRVVEDGSYLRLKNVTLGYSLPADLLGISGLTSARIYVKGRNLLTFTGYSGYNPDVNSSGQSTVNLKVDTNSYPLASEYMVGIDLSF